MSEIISTLTVKLNQKEFDLLETIKQEQGEKVATKTIKSLLLFPERYKAVCNEVADLKRANQSLLREIDVLKNQVENIVKEKNTEIESIKNRLNNFLCSFDELRNI
jgi:hypothetical protein